MNGHECDELPDADEYDFGAVVVCECGREYMVGRMQVVAQDDVHFWHEPIINGITKPIHRMRDDFIDYADPDPDPAEPWWVKFKKGGIVR